MKKDKIKEYFNINVINDSKFRILPVFDYSSLYPHTGKSFYLNNNLRIEKIRKVLDGIRANREIKGN